MAYGIEGTYYYECEGEGFVEFEGITYNDENDCAHGWNPLEDDGDAFRLAIKLNMTVDVGIAKSDYGEVRETAMARTDPNRATRHAITQLAALTYVNSLKGK